MNIAPSIEESVHKGLKLAQEKNHEFMTLEHFLWAAIKSPEVSTMLNAMGVNLRDLNADLEAHLEAMEVNPDMLRLARAPQPTVAFNRVLHDAVQMTHRHNRDQVSIQFVLLVLLDQTDSHANYFLQRHNVTQLKLKTYIAHGVPGLGRDPSVASDPAAPPEEKQSPLQKYAVNLNQRALDSKIDPLIGRSHEIERAAQILTRRRKNNPLLVGEPGVGKTAIAEGLARMIVEKSVPEALQDKEIWSLNLGAMVAGTKYRGDFEQRIKDVLDEVGTRPNVILFIDEIHTLIGAGAAGGSSMDASNIIKPALASGDLRVIGATTFQEYREVFERDKALDRRFQRVPVVEPTPAETVGILKGLKKTFETYHQVRYTAEAVQAAVDLSVKYMTDRFLPDKAIDVLDEAGAAERLKPAANRHKFIDRPLIEQVVAKMTNIPVSQVSQDDRDSLKTLQDDLRGVVFGQDEAIDKLATAVCVAKAGLNDERKPLGSFLFAGPTGVGKTEVARQLGLKLGIPLLRFDMSEYMEAHSVARLIGAPPGYVGHDKGGLLADAVFKNPHAILLLDEIEKAHPDIQNIMLQVMDNGSLTDSNGRNINFRNVFVVFTTNSGTKALQRGSMGFLNSDRSSEGRQEMEAAFAPEFRNRLDAVVTFSALGPDQILKIVDKNIKLLQDMLAPKGVTLVVDNDVRAGLAKDGYVPAMGARPMARLVQERLKKPLSQHLLFGGLDKGGQVSVGLKDGELSWTVTPNPPVEPVAKKRARRVATP